MTPFLFYFLGGMYIGAVTIFFLTICFTLCDKPKKGKSKDALSKERVSRCKMARQTGRQNKRRVRGYSRNKANRKDIRNTKIND